MSTPNLINSTIATFNQKTIPSKIQDDETVQTSNRAIKHQSKIQVKYSDNKENIHTAHNTKDKKIKQHNNTNKRRDCGFWRNRTLYVARGTNG